MNRKLVYEVYVASTFCNCHQEKISIEIYSEYSDHDQLLRMDLTSPNENGETIIDVERCTHTKLLRVGPLPQGGYYNIDLNTGKIYHVEKKEENCKNTV